MKMPFKNSIVIKSIIFLMIGVMGMLIINKGIFMHTHKIGDNQYIAHSHPYNKSNDSEPYKSHQHTKNEFLFFQNIEILFPLFFLGICLVLYRYKSFLCFGRKTEQIFTFIQTKNGRAPPFLNHFT
jgi:hypothetical protein